MGIGSQHGRPPDGDYRFIHRSLRTGQHDQHAGQPRRWPCPGIPGNGQGLELVETAGIVQAVTDAGLDAQQSGVLKFVHTTVDKPPLLHYKCASFSRQGIIMETYAVVETGGKQYRVKAQDVLRVELLDGAPGSTVTLQPVLALSDGKTLTIGSPFIAGASVKASIVKHMRDKKVIAYKKKRRKSYARKVGHRQNLTVIKVESFS